METDREVEAMEERDQVGRAERTGAEELLATTVAGVATLEMERSPPVLALVEEEGPTVYSKTLEGGIKECLGNELVAGCLRCWICICVFI